MSIEQLNVVDFISTNHSEEAVLTISDHLPWPGDNSHLVLLQDKLNSYLRFLESGEIITSYPTAKGKKVRINIVIKHQPTGDAPEFLERCKRTINEAGFELSWQIKSEDTTV